MSLATHAKKRIEIIVEAPALHQVTEALEVESVQGYTVLQAIAGRGHAGAWRVDDSFNDASHMVVVVCLVDAARVDSIVERIFTIVERQIGVLSVADVMVVRPGHF